MVRPTLALPLALGLAAPAVPVFAQQELSFVTPSGNIHCLMGSGFARCDLQDFTPSFRRPGDCDLDFGYAFEVDSFGGGYPLCAGDTVVNPAAQVLPYGEELELGDITCHSAESGVSCTNIHGGGFHVSRAAQRVF